LSSDYQSILKWSESRWNKICQGLTSRSTQVPITPEDLGLRYQLAEQMFPSGKGRIEESELFAAML
jgi:hypothetical protein